jgi:hypothetical protein
LKNTHESSVQTSPDFETTYLHVVQVFPALTRQVVSKEHGRCPPVFCFPIHVQVQNGELSQGYVHLYSDVPHKASTLFAIVLFANGKPAKP